MSMTFAPMAHLGHFLQVLIPGMFKSFKTGVLILRELRARFVQVLIMQRLAFWEACRPVLRKLIQNKTLLTPRSSSCW